MNGDQDGPKNLIGRGGVGASPRVLACLPSLRKDQIATPLAAEVCWCASIGEFLEALAAQSWDVLFLPFEAGGGDEVLARRVSERGDGAALFLVAAEQSVDHVLAAERAGAVGLLPDPPDVDLLVREVLPILTEPAAVPIQADVQAHEGGVVGSSPALLLVFRTVARAATTPATVLVTGESGTGKELVARALHKQGGRPAGTFVTVNCAAIPDTLLEAELFGYERGAFTGAVARSEGRFGRAHGGTLFLDEIGEMSLSLQAKLLRVLETGEIERLGSRDPVRVDVRIVAATNRDLRERAAAGAFREDLHFRLGVVEVELPPLRRRREDVAPLTHHFATRFSLAYGKDIRAFSALAWERLSAHEWPGNVRELRNVIDRAVILARGSVIRSGDLRLGEEAPRSSARGDRAGEGYPVTFSLRDIEGRHIRKVLAHTNGHMGEAARILGVHRNTMTAKVRDHGIDATAASSGH